MSVSLRVTGTWAELIADGSVAIPATPQAGDRMYLFARWKDFSVTAQVTSPEGWTKLVEFADGSVSSGNGTGSVKVACWYRDWQSGDTDPIIDFSAVPENASVVIMVMQKSEDDVWNTPIARTAAMTNWTNSSQVVSASATVAVPSGGVVMGLIGIRDDTATMTRSTTGIDDSVGAITWNGDYIESPAAHHSTTTGDDGATDLGYRLVSLGATATLRMTGTISAAETGAALWVIQGVTIAVTPAPASLALTPLTPTLKTAVIPTQAVLSLTTVAPLLSLGVFPSPVGLFLTPSTPLLSLSVVPNTALLGIASFIPTLFNSVAPEKATLTVSSLTPSLVLGVVPAIRELAISALTPTLTSAVIPPTFNLSVVTFSPFFLPFSLIWLDPGGDAVQAVGYFNAISGAGTASFDSSQKVVGTGSYKFDSSAGDTIAATIIGVLSPNAVAFSARRVSCYFRYDSVPDSLEVETRFVGTNANYSGGGFSQTAGDLTSDNELYVTAAPAKNAGQGSVFGSFGFDTVIPVGAAIDSVKIIYERKYDVNTSIGISRVKYRIDGIESPDNDNTDQPITDTVVTVNLEDRGFVREDLLDGVFEIIAEARRGDSDTAHTQSWDYVKVQVTWRLDGILEGRDSTGTEHSFKLGLSPKGNAAVIRLIDGLGASYYGITPILVNTQTRISFAYVQRDSNGINDLDINIFINGVLELSIFNVSTDGAPVFSLRYGWLDNPGAGHICHFDQIYIDDGNDLNDPGNILMTAKLPASINEDNWSTIGGTGAVNERPLNIANFKQHTPSTGARQSYTLQTADVGDVDISSETLKGYMGWAWAKTFNNSTVEDVYFIVNGVDIDRTAAFSQGANGVPLLLKFVNTSAIYPSNAAGVGMTGNIDTADVFLYECGVVVAYRPTVVNPNSLMAYQVLANGSTTNIVDDLREDPQDSYELCYRIDDGDANVLISIYSILSEGQSPQLQGICGGQGGYGRTRITPGIEVQVVLEVSGGSAGVSVWRRVNIA